MAAAPTPDFLCLAHMEQAQAAVANSQKSKPRAKSKPRKPSVKKAVQCPAEKIPSKLDASTWRAPIRGIVTSGYGYRPRMRRNHYGVDFALNMSDTIRAMADGVVTVRDFERRGYGYWLQLDHGNGVTTRYAHLRKFLVRVGDKVHAGQIIAIGGNSGFSTGPHLHFEIRLAGRPVNPGLVFDLSGTAHPKLAKTFAVSASSSKISIVPRVGDTKKTLAVATTPPAASSKPSQASATSEPVRHSESESQNYAGTMKGRIGYDYPYIVRKGDTLWGISRRYNVPIQKICHSSAIVSCQPIEVGMLLWFG